MMLRTKLCTWLFLVGLAASQNALAAEYTLQPLAELAPSKGVPPAVATQLAPQGVRIMRGSTRSLCDVWLCKVWPVKPDFTPDSSVLYPFQPGQLIGLIRYNSKGNDFRNQEIPAGMYTLRYGQQPVDGNHVGTSDTRDFLLLLPADQDTDAKPLAEADLFKLSPKASGGTHPTMLSMLRAGEGGNMQALRHQEDRELWSLRLVGQSAEKRSPLVIEFVVVGHAAE